MKTIRILGVPEHFNLPWELAIEEGAFEARGIDLQWQDIPEGTGKMSGMLQNKETELAVVLTEGIVKSMAEGNPVQIIQEYIASPCYGESMLQLIAPTGLYPTLGIRSRLSADLAVAATSWPVSMHNNRGGTRLNSSLKWSIPSIMPSGH